MNIEQYPLLQHIINKYTYIYNLEGLRKYSPKKNLQIKIVLKYFDLKQLNYLSGIYFGYVFAVISLVF